MNSSGPINSHLADLSKLRPPLIKEYVKELAERAQRVSLEVRILVAGFETPFWKLIEEDLVTRQNKTIDYLCHTPPNAANHDEIIFQQAFLNFVEVLLGLKTEAKKKILPPSP